MTTTIGLRSRTSQFHIARIVVLVASFMAATLVAPVAYAATITVTTTADEVNVNGTCSLREAILAANRDVAVGACPAGNGADSIHVPAGTYVLLRAGRNEDSADVGDLDIISDLTITGAGPGMTIIDGNAGDRVLDVFAASVTLSGLAIRNGDSFHGGAIRNTGTLALTNSIVIANRSFGGTSVNFDFTGRGGGIFNTGTMTLDNSTVSSNRTIGAAFSQGLGGGIYNSGGTVTLTDSTMSGNEATGRDSGGGGIYNTNGGSVALLRSTISDNIASGGAAGCTNCSGQSEGGGVFNNGSLTAVNSTISGNAAISPNTDIYGNPPTRGGGISNFGTVTLSNSTISYNRSESAGGIGGGGGIYTVGAATLENVLLAGNMDTDAQAPDCAGTFSLRTYNLIHVVSGCTITGDTAHLISGRDARLGPLQNNGGSTRTHALLRSSPAIDASLAGCPSTDQRGSPRPKDGNGDGNAACDLGAYELQTPYTGLSAKSYLPIVTGSRR